MDINPGMLTADKILELHTQIQVTGQLLSGALDSEIKRLEAANKEYKKVLAIASTLEAAAKIKADISGTLEEAKANAKKLIDEANAKNEAAAKRERDVYAREVAATQDNNAARIRLDAVEATEKNSLEALAAREAKVASMEADVSSRLEHVKAQEKSLAESQAKVSARLKALEKVD